MLALVRTLGGASLPAALLLMLLRRQFRGAVVMTAAAAVLLVPWQLWMSAWQHEIPPVLMGKYGASGPWMAQGIQEGTPQFAEYARDAQTILDSADPLNFIASARARRPLLLLQVVGGGLLRDGNVSPADQVILNSSTQRLIDAANLTRISMLGENAATAGFVNFILGDHGSIIRPGANLATTVEMHHQSISFATSLGNTVHISDLMVVQP